MLPAYFCLSNCLGKINSSPFFLLLFILKVTPLGTLWLTYRLTLALKESLTEFKNSVSLSWYVANDYVIVRNVNF